MYQVVSTYNDDKLIQFLVGKHIQKSEWNHRLMSQVFCWPNVFPLQQSTDFASKTPLISSNQKDPKFRGFLCNTSSDPKLQTKSNNLETHRNYINLDFRGGVSSYMEIELIIGNNFAHQKTCGCFSTPKISRKLCFLGSKKTTPRCNSLVLQDKMISSPSIEPSCGPTTGWGRFSSGGTLRPTHFVRVGYQLDDESKSLHKKWLEITISIHWKMVV